MAPWTCSVKTQRSFCLLSITSSAVFIFLLFFFCYSPGRTFSFKEGEPLGKNGFHSNISKSIVLRFVSIDSFLLLGIGIFEPIPKSSSAAEVNWDKLVNDILANKTYGHGWFDTFCLFTVCFRRVDDLQSPLARLNKAASVVKVSQVCCFICSHAHAHIHTQLTHVLCRQRSPHQRKLLRSILTFLNCWKS